MNLRMYDWFIAKGIHLMRIAHISSVTELQTGIWNHLYIVMRDNSDQLEFAMGELRGYRP